MAQGMRLIVLAAFATIGLLVAPGVDRRSPRRARRQRGSARRHQRHLRVHQPEQRQRRARHDGEPVPDRRRPGDRVRPGRPLRVQDRQRRRQRRGSRRPDDLHADRRRGRTGSTCAARRSRGSPARRAACCWRTRPRISGPADGTVDGGQRQRREGVRRPARRSVFLRLDLRIPASRHLAGRPADPRARHRFLRRDQLQHHRDRDPGRRHCRGGAGDILRIWGTTGRAQDDRAIGQRLPRRHADRPVRADRSHGLPGGQHRAESHEDEGRVQPIGAQRRITCSARRRSCTWSRSTTIARIRRPSSTRCCSPTC